MRVIVCKNYEEMSQQGAKLIASQVFLKPDSILGLATGSTPIGVYKNLIDMNRRGEVDFSEIITFNLDEYYPMSPENPQSYRYFMDNTFFNHINIKKENTHVPNGLAENPDAACAGYEAQIEEAGGIDFQLLGIGQNGHIGFNEPDDNLNVETHITGLTESTIQANSRFFENIADVPTKALTMGIATILKSRKICLMASGVAKAKIVKELLNNELNTTVPATMLKVHPDVVLICDKEAYGKEN